MAPGGPAIRVDMFTIFPDLVDGWLGASLIGKARRAGLLDLRVHDLRSAATDPHRSVDDTPFGGGAGMVLAPEPVFRAVEADRAAPPALLLGPAGRRFDQAMARGAGRPVPGSRCCAGATRGSTSASPTIWSTASCRSGDFVLAGGEVAALVVVEAVARLVPGVMGNERPPPRRASPTGCWSTRSTPGRPSSGAGRCPRCCAPATTAGSPAGGGPRPWPGPAIGAPTCWPPEAA